MKMEKLNFTENEKKLIVDLVLKSRDILDNPKNDPQAVASKGKKWAEITNEYNSHFPEKKRTVDQMRKAWEQAKKWSSDPRLTGIIDGAGEPHLTDDSIMQEKLKSRLRRSDMNINEDQIKKIAQRRLMLEAKKIKELTKSEMEIHNLDIAEQKLRVAIAKEQLNQERLRTKLMSLSMELEEKEKKLP